MKNNGIFVLFGTILVLLISGCTQPSPSSQKCEYRFYVGVSGSLPLSEYRNFTDFVFDSAVSEIEFPEANCRCEFETGNQTKCTHIEIVISNLDDEKNAIIQRKDSDILEPMKPREWLLEKCYCGVELLGIY